MPLKPLLKHHLILTLEHVSKQINAGTLNLSIGLYADRVVIWHTFKKALK